MVTIRSTQPTDRDAVVTVVRAAFSRDHRDPQEEVDIVTETWALGAAPDGLDLVAVEDATLVGYVVAARGRMSDTEVLGVAPLAVTPARQRAGIGTALMTELIARAEAQGWPLLVLLGDPAYYERFGFESAAALGITAVLIAHPDAFPAPTGPSKPPVRQESAVGETSLRVTWSLGPQQLRPPTR